jgi:hypothetical protein
MTTTGQSATGGGGARGSKEAATNVGPSRRWGGAALAAAVGAACALGLTSAAAPVAAAPTGAAPPDHVHTLRVASLTIARDRATGTVSGFPKHRKVTINKAPYVADRSGDVHLSRARLNGLKRLELNFFDANGDLETGAMQLKDATTGISLTSAQLHSAKPNRTKAQTMRLSITPAMFSPPPSRPKAKG